MRKTFFVGTISTPNWISPRTCPPKKPPADPIPVPLASRTIAHPSSITTTKIPRVSHAIGVWRTDGILPPTPRPSGTEGARRKNGVPCETSRRVRPLRGPPAGGPSTSLGCPRPQRPTKQERERRTCPGLRSRNGRPQRTRRGTGGAEPGVASRRAVASVGRP